jgi:four helix bundle protein
MIARITSFKLRITNYLQGFSSKLKSLNEMKESIIQQKSYVFAKRIIKLYQYLIKEFKEYELSKQILRCGTSIGSNIEEAEGGQSDKDFISKISIAYKEARETKYRLRLLHDTDYINLKMFNSLFNDCEELLKIIGKIQITMKMKVKS